MLTQALNNNETSSINRLNKEIHNIINKINLDDLQYKQVIKIKLDSITKKILNLQYEQSNINRSSSPNKNKLYEIKKNIRIQKERLYKIRKTEEKRIAFYYKSIVEILRKLEHYYYNEKENSNSNVMDFVEKQIRYYLYKLKTLDEAQVMLMKYKINFMRNSIKQLNKLNRSQMNTDEKKILSHKINVANKRLAELNNKLKIFVNRSQENIHTGRYNQYLDDLNMIHLLSLCYLNCKHLYY
jgi:hypothetical protein